MHSEEQFVNGLYQLVNLYYNYTGNVAKFCANAAVCGDSAYSALGSPLGWPWQVTQLNVLFHHQSFIQ
jgi:hypothetical protein